MYNRYEYRASENISQSSKCCQYGIVAMSLKSNNIVSQKQILLNFLIESNCCSRACSNMTLTRLLLTSLWFLCTRVTNVNGNE